MAAAAAAKQLLNRQTIEANGTSVNWYKNNKEEWNITYEISNNALIWAPSWLVLMFKQGYFIINNSLTGTFLHDPT